MKKWLKSPIKFIVTLIIYILGLACLVFLVFQDYLKLSGYLLSILLIILPFYLYARLPKLRSNVSFELINYIQLIIAIACFNNLLGSLDFYKNLSTWWYDVLIHFINPLLIFSITPIFVIAFQKYFFPKQHLLITLIGNLLLIIFCSFLWEFYEALIDKIFKGATMLGQHGEVYKDTLTDLAADLSGGLVASWLVYKSLYKYLLNNTVRYFQNGSQGNS